MKTIRYHGKEYPVREIAGHKISTLELSSVLENENDEFLDWVAEDIDSLFIGYVSAEEINLPEKELFLLLEKYGIL